MNLTVSDWEYDVVASGTVYIYPAGEVFVDWDKGNYGYIIQLDGDVEENSDLDINITDETTSTTDTDYHISPSNATFAVHATSNLVPVPGHVLNITMTYKGRKIANRVIEVVGQSMVPAGQLTATYDMSMSSHMQSADSERWMNMSGSNTMKFKDDRSNMSAIITDSDFWAYEVDGSENQTMTGSADGSTFNTTVLYNDEEYSDSFMEQVMQMEIRDSGLWMGSVNVTGYEKTINNLTMDVYGEWDGEMIMGAGRLNVTTLTYDIGFENHTNGDGVDFDCIKVYGNMTLEGYIAPPPLPLDHYAITNVTTTWRVQDTETYSNRDIYVEYNSTWWFINDSKGGVWEWMNSEEGAIYLDEDGDGTYNPDPPEQILEEVMDFEGVSPRELKVGDKVATKNSHGSVVTYDVVEIVDMTVGSKDLKAAKIEITYGGLAGLSGGGTGYVVAEGEYTGLMLEVHEVVDYTNPQNEDETQYQDTVIQTITDS